MHFEGEFSLPGKATDVIRRFADVPRMASCMPGAVLEPQAEDGSWPGAMVVSFGPKKINFKGKATCDFDDQALTGPVHGRGTAGRRSDVRRNTAATCSGTRTSGCADFIVGRGQGLLDENPPRCGPFAV